MKKYVFDLQLFSKKLCSLMIEKNLTYGDNKPDPIALYNALYPNDKIVLKEMAGFNRSDYTQKTRAQYNWIHGKSCPKNISDILNLCNTLDCDLDYLFTNMPCKTHDKQFIQDKTGLSEKSIDTLMSWYETSKNSGKEYAWARNAIRALNDLLYCHMYFCIDVLNQVASYCYHRNIYEDINTDTKTKSESLRRFQLALFSASNGLCDCIKDIYKKNKEPSDIS